MITIYGSPNCLPCLQAKQLCQGYEYRYEFIDVVNDLDNKQAFMLKYPNVERLPVIEWFGHYVGGYEQFLTEIENTMNYGEGKL